MTPPADKQVQCNVIGGDQLDADTGGAEGLCDSIEAAAAVPTDWIIQPEDMLL